MIGAAWRRLVGLLGSAVLATWLLAIAGAWSVLGSLVPQGGASDSTVKAWAAAYPLAEPIVRAVGLHQAFSSPVFLVCILVLGISTALCAWQRTKVALAKGRTLQQAAAIETRSLADSHDLEIRCAASLSGPEALSVASETLSRLGIETRRKDDLLSAVSPVWSVWGSPVFHWALLALILTLLGGNLFRAQGLMGVAVGQTKPDAPDSYGTLSTGPLHSWGRVSRAIRVDAFEPRFTSDGIDRGPTPTVSLLDGDGAVIMTQRVYPNMTLKSGSLTIYPDDFGLAVTVSTIASGGVETGSAVMLVDFSKEATTATVPVDHLTLSDSAGKPLYLVSVTVPLDIRGNVVSKRVPVKPTARVVVSTPDGTPRLTGVIGYGESLTVPGANASLRLDGVGYYARLSVVDDWSIPLLYAGMVAAMIGLTFAAAARQQIVLATVIDGPDGVKLAMRVRLWRNSPSSRREIESELARALGAVEEEDKQ